jgi:hypothetical protein
MKPKRVTTYETTDKQLFRDKAEAKRHQAWLDLENICNGFDARDYLGEQSDGRALVRFIQANGDEIVRLLKELGDYDITFNTGSHT